MRVFVVMGNDYPAAVYDSERAAEKRCHAEMAKNERRLRDGYGKIFWRYYDFTLNAPSAA